MTIRTEKSKKMTVPRRPRRESSPTALKVAAEKRELTHCVQGSGERQEGLATLIKEKGQRGQGIEDEGQKREAVHSTHGQRREAWKNAESSGVTKSGYQVQICRLSLVRVLGYCWDRPTVL